MRSWGIRIMAWLSVLVVILLPIYHYAVVDPSWLGDTEHLESAPLSLVHATNECTPRESSFSHIFFLETGGRGIITARMACAVESAARAHPNWTVHLLTVDAINDSSTPFVNLLGSIQNVVLSNIEPQEEFEGTPLGAWYRSGALNNSSYPAVHLADALRLAVLYNHGGVYLDIDVVVMRPLDCLPSFVCRSPAVLDHRKFLPLHYYWSAVFFAANASQEVWDVCNGSYVMHVYSKRTSKMLSEPGSAYRQAAKAYCPDSLQLSLNLTGQF